MATNHNSQYSTDVTQQVSAVRWKIEEFHRDLKQLTGVESCQCRKARIQRRIAYGTIRERLGGKLRVVCDKTT